MDNVGSYVRCQNNVRCSAKAKRSLDDFVLVCCRQSTFFVPRTKSNFLECKTFLIMFWLSKKLSDYKSRTKQNQGGKNVNMLLGNDVILAARQRQEHNLISSAISTHRQK